MARRPMGQPDEGDQGKSEDQKIIDEAKHRFKRAQDWEGEVRQLGIEDTKFANGDSDNGWQWPDNVKKDRDVRNVPCLTINKTKMHVLALANEARQNPPQARIKPVGGETSYKAAEIWEGLVRHIEYVSAAASVYIQAKEQQLEAGIGYYLITHDYVDDKSFDQDVKLEPLHWLNVFLDCDIKRVDGSDAMWGFVFDEYDRKEFGRQFPNISLPPPRSPGLDDKDDWIRKDAVRVAQYYRINLTEDELLYLEDEEGNSWTGLRSEIPDPWRKMLKDYEVGKVGADFKKRKVMRRQLEWFKIGGNEIIDRKDGKNGSDKLKGHYIPIIRMPGRERVVEGRLYRAGVVRQLKDPQRMYNYNTSGEVEVVALQTKSPWIIPAEAIEGNEAAWNNANTSNAAYLTYRGFNEEGEKIDPPQRMNPPVPAEGFLEGLRIAASEMEMVSGQYMGQPQSNQSQLIERTPKAVDQRARMGELANYDFTDNEMQAIRHTAIVILDIAPFIYDTERIIKIRAQDGTVSEVNINPDMDTAFEQEKQKDAEEVKVLFNPKVGKYAVEADVGPSYQTQRQEAWNAFVQIVSSSPELMNMMGDLGFLAADWPMADKIAERFRRHIEQTAPWLLEDSKTGPIVQQLTQELQNSQGQVAELLEKLADARLKVRGKDEMRDIESFNADTKRGELIVKAVEKLGLTEQQRAQFEHELTSLGHQHVYNMIEQANAPTVNSENGKTNGKRFDPASIGAKKAPDGRHYLPDPRRPGKYLLVA